MESLLESVLMLVEACLISFGLAFCFALTSGPFGIFEKTREGIRRRTSQEWLKEGVGCQICISFYTSFVTASLLASSVQEGLVLWLSAVGFTCTVTSLSPE